MGDEKENEIVFARKTISGMIWIVLGRGGNVLLQTVVIVILARMLNAKEYGIVTASMVSIGFCEIFLQKTIPFIIVQKRNVNDDYLANCRSFSLILGLILFIVNIVYANFADQLWGIEGLKKYVTALSIIFLIQSITIVDEGVFQKELEFKFLSIRRIISYGLGYGLVGITLALLGLGPWSLIFAYIIQNVINTLLLLFHKKSNIRLKIQKEEFLHIANQTIGYSLNRLGTFFAQNGDNFIIGRFLGPITLGIYGRAYQFFSLPTSYLGEMFEKGLFSSLSANQRDVSKMRIYFLNSFSLLILTVIPMSLMMSIFSKEIILILLGENWLESEIPFKILSLGIFFRVAYKLFDAVIKSVGLIFRNAIIEIFYAITIIIGALIGVSRGLKWVSVLVLFAIILNAVIAYYVCNKILKIKYRDLIVSNYKKLIAIGLLTVVALSIKETMNDLTINSLLINSLIAGIVIFISYYLIFFKIFKFKEINELIRLLKKER